MRHGQAAGTRQEEDRRRICRERRTVLAERIEHVNRIKGLLFAQGVFDYEPLHRNCRARLDALKTGDVRCVLPDHLKAQIGRELDRLELVVTQLKAVEAERDALLEQTGEIVTVPARALANLKGIGAEHAAVIWSEGFFRSFANRRQVAAYALSADALAKWIGRPRTRGVQGGKPAAANGHDPVGLVVAATPTRLSAQPMVPRESPS